MSLSRPDSAVIFVIVFCLTMPAQARMYQWTEPGTGTTQLSGKPPAWYRSAEGGPRVFVFDGGRLIDDTAVRVSEEIRLRMRQRAFVIAEEDRQKALEKIAKSKTLKNKLEQENPAASDQPWGGGWAAATADTKPQDIKPAEDKTASTEAKREPADLTEKNIEELKAMISEWEDRRTESAKQVIGR